MEVINTHQDLAAIDDGTNIDFNFQGTTQLSVVKATGDLLISGDIKTRESL